MNEITCIVLSHTTEKICFHYSGSYTMCSRHHNKNKKPVFNVPAIYDFKSGPTVLAQIGMSLIVREASNALA